MFKLSKNSKKLLLLQRNELLTKKQKWLRKKFGRFLFTNLFIYLFQNKNIEKLSDDLFLKEFQTFKNYLPTNVKNVMDVGCGLGIININLSKNYSNDTNFFLLDKNHIDKKIKYGFNLNYESYNFLDETKNILKNNNINQDCIHLFNVEKEITISKKMDLVISLKSMGYHYPFETYLELFKRCCTIDTIFIFDISVEKYNEMILKKYFENIQIIYQEKSIHSMQRLYCTRFKF